MQKKVREKIKNENYTTRLIVYLLGLFIMTLGISMSVKSDLGVSPVSSIPYTITCITGLEMGKATIVFHIALVALRRVSDQKSAAGGCRCGVRLFYHVFQLPVFVSADAG